MRRRFVTWTSTPVLVGPLVFVHVTLVREGRALAVEGEVTSDTVAQFYDVRGPTGDVVIPRRRITTMLGVAAYDLFGARETPRKPGELPAEYTFRLRVRYDADFGAGGLESDPRRVDRFVPGFSDNLVDLQYGYLEGRRVFGFLGFRVGRQYVTDALGWTSFDGATVRATMPFAGVAEASAGLEVRGGLPLSASRWEKDGVFRGTRVGFDPYLYPDFQPASVAPLYGVALETDELPWLRARVSYRRVENTGPSALRFFSSPLAPPGAYDGVRLSSERVGGSFDLTAGSVGSLRAGLAYENVASAVASAWASVDGFLGRRVTLGTDFDYYAPTFDGDSIFRVFAAEPSAEGGLRASVDVTDAFALSAGSSIRGFGQGTGPSTADASPYAKAPATAYPTSSVWLTQGGYVTARYRDGVNVLGLRAQGHFGEGSHRVGADVYGETRWGDRYRAEGRVSLFDWADTLRPDRDALGFGYVLGFGYRFAPRCEARVEWEHSMNRLVGERLRGIVWLSVAVMR